MEGSPKSRIQLSSYNSHYIYGDFLFHAQSAWERRRVSGLEWLPGGLKGFRWILGSSVGPGCLWSGVWLNSWAGSQMTGVQIAALTLTDSCDSGGGAYSLLCLSFLICKRGDNINTRLWDSDKGEIQCIII